MHTQTKHMEFDLAHVLAHDQLPDSLSKPLCTKPIKKFVNFTPNSGCSATLAFGHNRVCDGGC